MTKEKLASSIAKNEKPDYKQMLLDLIHKQSGPMTAVIMDKALKTQDKQVEEAMTQGGMTAEQIAQSKGLDLNQLLDKTPKEETTPTEQPQVGFEQRPPTSPFAFGGVGVENNNVVFKQPGAVGEFIGGTNATTQMLQQAELLQKLLGGAGGTKGVYGFDPATGNVTLRGQIPEKSELRMEQPSTGIESLSPEEQPIARALARRLYGVRGAEKGLPAIVNARKEGKNFDQIEDSIRFSSQSPEFTNSVRNAAQNISINDSDAVRNANFDALDDFIQQGDMGSAKDYLKRLAIKNGTVSQQQNVMGQERTIDLLNEIQGDLQTLEKEGFPTGFWSGNIDKLMSKVGQVKNPKHMQLATRIALAVMQYRRDMTGVQFGMKEHAEYQRVFPDINKVNTLNMVSINGLTNVFYGNIEKFYRQSMGTKNYNKVFKEDVSNIVKETETPNDEYQQMLQILQRGK